MQVYYRIAADIVVLIHMTYVLVVVVGLPVTWIGLFCRANWARNVWWRCGHVAMILIVVFEALMGITCPLTTWEYELRQLAQQETYQGAFIGNLIHHCLFTDLPKWVLTLCYAAFGLLVMATFIMAPPRWPTPRQPQPDS